MAQAVWSGSLSFGLVHIPVKLYNATTPRDVRFRQLQRDTGRRIRYRRVVAEAPESSREQAAPSEEQAAEARPAAAPARAGQPEVAYEDVVKGFELEPDRYVMVDPAELEALAPERSRVIEIEDFVDLADIDPVLFEKSYYLAPALGVGAEKPYWLLLRAMERAGKVGMARFVLRTKEYLAAVRPGSGILVLETLFYADEVRDPAELHLPQEMTPAARELDMAVRLIESLTVPWDPTRYRDTYRERVLELVRSKAEEGGAIVEEAPPPEPAPVFDLMEALKASVEAARAERGAAEPEPGRPPAKKRTHRSS